MKPLTEFLPQPLPADPLPLAARWLQDAWAAMTQPNPNAMVLATVDARGQPSARVVLCKEIDTAQGQLVFFTNYESRKGQDLAQNARAAVVMHWDALHRQMRIEGVVSRAAVAESDAYFATRPWQRQVGAWASAQSRPLTARSELEAAVARTAQRFGAPLPGPEDDAATLTSPIPRPTHWGGYRLSIEAIEFWTEGASRLHDRARWTRSLPAAGPWSVTRLQP
jgi:pyridoxamine 5'-phosphate oxidase